jgi:hypothetical protein
VAGGAVSACICWLNVPFQERARMDRNVEIDPNCPDHGGHGHEHTLGLAAKVRIGQLERLLLATDERAKRAEAEVRAKDETIGELLELIPDGLGEGTWTRIDHLAAEDWAQYKDDIRLGRFS